MSLQIGQRWRHIYDGFNYGRHDYHSFVVEVIEITESKVKCKIVQIVSNNNETMHANHTVGTEYLVTTIPRDKDYA